MIFLIFLSFFGVLGSQNHSKPSKPPFSIQVKPVNADFPGFRPKSGLSQLFPEYSWKNKNGKQGGSISKRPMSSKVGVLNLLYPISLVRKTLIYRLLKISEDFAAQESSYEPKCSGTLMICPKTESRSSDGLKIFFENQDLALVDLG